MSQRKNTASDATRALLVSFGNALKELAEHQEQKSRPIAGIDMDSFVSTFAQEHSGLIGQAQGPDLENLFLVSGRVHGDDDDSCYVIEGDNPTGRFAYELLGFDPDVGA